MDLPIIVSRGEFVDALDALARGHVMVRVAESDRCVIDGCPVWHSATPLLRYGLVQRFHNPEGFPEVEYYRLSGAGRDFARRALNEWRRRPLLERLAVRLAG